MWNCAVAVATGSPAGLSALPVMATAKARPPEVGLRTVFGHAPAGAGTMSAGRLRAARSAAPETRCLTYGFVLDAVRWQIVVLAAVVRALAAVSAIPAQTSATRRRANGFMSLLLMSSEGCLSPVSY